MRRFLPALVLLASSLLPSLVLAQASLSGRVVRADSGIPLAGMVVAAYSADGSGQPITNVTAGDGKWTIAVPAPAAYRLVAWDPDGVLAPEFYREAGSFETSAEIKVAQGQSITGLGFHLVSAAHIEGVVTAPFGEAAGMTVAAYNMDGTRRAFEKTGAAGNFRLTVPPGKYKLVAWDDQGTLAPEFYSEKKRFADAAVVDAAGVVKGIGFTLETGARVSGVVKDDRALQPLSGIRIGALNLKGEEVAYTRSNADGRFSFSLPVGAYKFVATDDDRKYATEFATNVPTFQAAASFSLVAGQSFPGIDFTLSPLATGSLRTLWLPAAANGPGNFGSYWQTDLWLNNPGREPLTVALSYVAQGEPGAAAATIVRTVPGLGQLEIPNVVSAVANRTGNGAIRLEADAPFLATSRTYNTPANGSEVGTFGFSMPALGLTETFSSSVLAGLANGAVFRSNIGVFNPHDHALELTYTLYSASGGVLAESTREVPSLGWSQSNLAEIPGFPAATSGSYLIVRSAAGSFYSWASLVDNRSNDPSLILPSPDLRDGL